MATVLIVEDEDVLRETLSSFLTRQGHDVIAAASGYEALEIGLDASLNGPRAAAPTRCGIAS